MEIKDKLDSPRTLEAMNKLGLGAE